MRDMGAVCAPAAPDSLPDAGRGWGWLLRGRAGGPPGPLPMRVHVALPDRPQGAMLTGVMPANAPDVVRAVAPLRPLAAFWEVTVLQRDADAVPGRR